MKKEKTVLVCITPQESSKQLVKSGKVLAEKHGAKLEVVSVLPLCRDGGQFSIKPDVIENLYQTAKNENGEMALIMLSELFNHSNISITKRYLGLRREELLRCYDLLEF